jgi:Putative DNA-binding domain
MTVNRSDIEKITEGDLQELKDNEVGEGILYEYKLDLYGTSDADKKEFLKDASSFANTAGGHIVIGVKEDQGLPIDFPGVSTDLDKEKLRLENLLRDRIEPRILGTRMQPVDLENGRRVLVIRIPRSWDPPHAVLQNKSRLIFARNSAGVHEASVDEMRAMFNIGADLLERAREFQRKRQGNVHDGAGPLGNLLHDGRLMVHIIPFTAVSQESTIDLNRLEPGELVPIWCSGCNYGYNVDGRWTTSDTGDRSGYVQVFRNGIVETAAADVRSSSNRGPYLLTEAFEGQITIHIEKYLASLRRAGVALPAYVMVAGTRMAGSYVFVNPHSPLPPAVHPLPMQFQLPTVLIEDFSTIEEYRQALKPLFDAIWNAAGYAGSKSYNSNGRWIRRS